MFYSSIHVKRSGLTNQVIAFITSILIAHKNKHKVVVFDTFLNDFSKNKYTPISQIFNLSQINNFLKSKYDIIVSDKYNTKLEISCVKYGTEQHNLDITEHIIQNFYKNNTLYINKNINFNNINGDPCVGVNKQIFLNYRINDYLVEEVYDADLINVSIDFLNSKYLYPLNSISCSNSYMFQDILKNIYYNNIFLEISEKNVKQFDTNQKINIIHLRLENDAIKHWSKINNTTEQNFKNYIENKYINLFKKYITNTEQNIILSSALNPRVINFLRENNYNFKFIPKFFKDREKNAIIDFLVSKSCNNIFIGNGGSTFSFYIDKTIQNNIKKIFIDLDNIFNDECVISN